MEPEPAQATSDLIVSQVESGGWTQSWKAHGARTGDIAFDERRGHLLIVDHGGHRVLVVDATNGALVREIKGSNTGPCRYPYGIAVDAERDRLILTIEGGGYLETRALSDPTLMSAQYRIGGGHGRWQDPSVSLAIGSRCDCLAVLVQLLHEAPASILGSPTIRLMEPTRLEPTMLDETQTMGDARVVAVAIDDVLGRILLATDETIEVYDNASRCKLFGFAANHVRGICTDHIGRIIACMEGGVIMFYTPDGASLREYQAQTDVWCVAVDRTQGLIAYGGPQAVGMLVLID